MSFVWSFVLKSVLVCFTSLCPSVETATVVFSDICKRTPVRAGFSSSRLTAKEVVSIISFKVFPGIVIDVGVFFRGGPNYGITLAG